MYYELNNNEVLEFTHKYLPSWHGEISKVTKIEYDLVQEYLVNNHYLVIIKPNGQVIMQDLQDND